MSSSKKKKEKFKIWRTDSENKLSYQKTSHFTEWIILGVFLFTKMKLDIFDLQSTRLPVFGDLTRRSHDTVDEIIRYVQ